MLSISHWGMFDIADSYVAWKWEPKPNPILGELTGAKPIPAWWSRADYPYQALNFGPELD